MNFAEFKFERTPITGLIPVGHDQFAQGSRVVLHGRHYAVINDDLARSLVQVESHGRYIDAIARVVRVVPVEAYRFAGNKVVFEWPATTEQRVGTTRRPQVDEGPRRMAVCG
jgi:hypothetical protein